MKWTDEDRYTVVQVKTIKAKPKDLREGKRYQVKFQQTYYEALLLALGDAKHCNSEMAARIEVDKENEKKPAKSIKQKTGKPNPEKEKGDFFYFFQHHTKYVCSFFYLI